MKTKLSDWNVRTRLQVITALAAVTMLLVALVALNDQIGHWQTADRTAEDTVILVAGGKIMAAVEALDATETVAQRNHPLADSLWAERMRLRGDLERQLLGLEQIAASSETGSAAESLGSFIDAGRAAQNHIKAGTANQASVNGMRNSWETLTDAIQRNVARSDIAAIPTLGHLSSDSIHTAIAYIDSEGAASSELAQAWTREQADIAHAASLLAGERGDRLRVALSNGSQAGYTTTLRRIMSGSAQPGDTIDASAITARLSIIADTQRQQANLIEQAAADQAEDAARDVTLLAAAILTGLAVSLAATRLIARTITANIDELTDAASALAQGEQAATVRVSASEFGTVQNALGQVSDMLASVAHQAGNLAHGSDRASVAVPGPIGRALDAAFDQIDDTTAKLADREAMSRAIIEAVGATWTLDSRGTVTSANRAAYDLLGGPSKGRHYRSFIGALCPELVLDGRSVTGLETELIGRNGRRRVALLTLNPVENRDAYVLAALDITERKEFEQKLAALAVSDPLTGLPNRAGIDADITRRFQAEHYQPFSALFIDLDRFKAVNDTHGHAAGDELLLTVCERISAAIKSGDVIGRLAGDEFVALLDHATIDEARGVAQRILDSISQPYAIAGADVTVGASIGVVHVSEPQQTGEQILAQADLAMYVAKNNGRGRVEVFDETLAAQTRRRRELEAALAAAIQNGELQAHYQPVVNLERGDVVGVELLARWTHQGQAIPPNEFIPIAEDSGLVVDLGIWAINQAAATAARWRAANPTGSEMHVAVNVSSVHLLRGTLVADVTAALDRHGCDASDLVLELTETSLVNDVQAARDQLAALRDLGVRIAIDDFGTGYASLGYLRNLPVDTVKIDRSFVSADNEAGIADDVFVKSIAGLAHGLNLDIVAEGIETPDQLAMLEAIGCGNGQGYLFSRPLPLEEMETYLAQHGWPPATIHAKKAA